MDGQNHSSGNLLADRRYAYAQDLLAEGDAVAAADLLAQTLDIVPHWAPAWMALAGAQERQGRTAEALEAFRRADACDPDGHLGAALHLTRLGQGDPPFTMPPAYVAALFDGYAPRFERHLLESLAYRGPAVVLDALEEVCGEQRFTRALDLGCGTGLMGAAIADRTNEIEGVDLSPAMVDRAAASGIYARITVGEIGPYLDESAAEHFDLVLAADVFVYLGALGPTLAGIARVLAPGGVLAFTVQKAEGDAVRLGEDMRFSHGADHIRAGLDAAGLRSRLLREASTRQDGGRPVPGLVVVAEKPYF